MFMHFSLQRRMQKDVVAVLRDAHFFKVAKKMQRSPDTISRYVHEYEAAIGAVRVVLDAKI